MSRPQLQPAAALVIILDTHRLRHIGAAARRWPAALSLDEQQHQHGGRRDDRTHHDRALVLASTPRATRASRSIGSKLKDVQSLSLPLLTERSSDHNGRPKQRKTQRSAASPRSHVPFCCMIKSLHIADASTCEMRLLQTATLIAGRGIDGDRYCSGCGTYSVMAEPGRQLTLISASSAEESLAVAGLRRGRRLGGYSTTRYRD